MDFIVKCLKERKFQRPSVGLPEKAFSRTPINTVAQKLFGSSLTFQCNKGWEWVRKEILWVLKGIVFFCFFCWRQPVLFFVWKYVHKCRQYINSTITKGSTACINIQKPPYFRFVICTKCYVSTSKLILVFAFHRSNTHLINTYRFLHLSLSKCPSLKLLFWRKSRCRSVRCIQLSIHTLIKLYWKLCRTLKVCVVGYLLVAFAFICFFDNAFFRCLVHNLVCQLKTKRLIAVIAYYTQNKHFCKATQTTRQ